MYLTITMHGHRNTSYCTVYFLSPGNNIYGIDIRTKLKELSSSQQREKYILMERIQPPAIPGVIWWRGKDNQIANHPVVNELGIYGAYVR